MSIHVCRCQNNGKEEFHLRYPGMTEGEAQDIADMINGGALDLYQRVKMELNVTNKDDVAASFNGD